jgi:hypothetical protein
MARGPGRVITPASCWAWPTVVPEMPANLTPECKAADAAHRHAGTPEDRLASLRQMLRTIPKHKGTEDLRGDIKTRIKGPTHELAVPRKGGARTGPASAQGVASRPGEVVDQLERDVLQAEHARLRELGGERVWLRIGVRASEPAMQRRLLGIRRTEQRHQASTVRAHHGRMADPLQPADGCLLVVDLGEPACVEQTIGPGGSGPGRTPISARGDVLIGPRAQPSHRLWRAASSPSSASLWPKSTARPSGPYSKPGRARWRRRARHALESSRRRARRPRGVAGGRWTADTSPATSIGSRGTWANRPAMAMPVAAASASAATPSPTSGSRSTGCSGRSGNGLSRRCGTPLPHDVDMRPPIGREAARAPR